MGPFLQEFDHETKITRIGNTNELESAYAADAYAKITGKPGVVAVTYGVGSLTAINGVAGSFVEQVLVLSS